MIEMSFSQVVGLTAIACLVVFYIICVILMGYDIIRSCVKGIKLLRHYIFYKKMKPGDIYEYEGKVNQDNPFDDLRYLSRIQILDIKDKHIKYTADYIVSDEKGRFNLNEPRSRFTRIEKWWIVTDQRELTKYHKLLNFN